MSRRRRTAEPVIVTLDPSDVVDLADQLRGKGVPGVPAGDEVPVRPPRRRRA